MSVTVVWPSGNDAVGAYLLGLAFSLDLGVVRDTHRLLWAGVLYGLVITAASGSLMLARKGAVLGGKAGFQQCYDAALKLNSTVQGTVTVKWNLNGRGEPSNVSKVESTLPASVDTCVMAQVLGLKFPKPRSGIAQIRYPFIFTKNP